MKKKVARWRQAIVNRVVKRQRQTLIVPPHTGPALPTPH